MSTLFLQQLLLSVIVAGTWITLATMLSEKMGSKTGGMIANLPSTILVSLLFIGITQTPEFAAQAAINVPLGMFFSTMFLYVFISLIPRGLPVALITGLATWFLLAFLFSRLQADGHILYTLLYFTGAVGTYLIAEKILKIPSLPKVKKRYTIWQLLFRAVFAGSVVGISVIIGRTGSAFWAGLSSAFPATILSTMVILSLSAGYPFARATGKVMLLASTNIVIYSFMVGAVFPLFGLWWGTLISYAVSALWVYLLKPLFDRGI
ncbi:MAG: DUF3147 family protein [Bacteroidales bacterium]